MAEMIKQIKTAFILLLFFTVITGIIYPALITGIAQGLFPVQANGSLIEENGKILGSKLIGQNFTDPKYFWGRPSATSPYPYNAANSSGSNLGPANPDLFAKVKERMTKFQQDEPLNMDLIPVDLVTASGSGLDPEISPLAAYYQISRVANARGKTESDIRILVDSLIKQRTLGFLGEPRINVLELNLALDRM
jgi:K+-transporting ATPase ATPase C chain